MNVLTAVSANNITAPDKVAIRTWQGNVTYGELEESVSRQAALIRSLTGTEKAVVGVLMPSGAGLVTALLACFRSGNIYMPLNVRFSTGRLLEVIRHTQSRIILTDAEIGPLVRDLGPVADGPLACIVRVHPGGAWTVYDTRTGQTRDVEEAACSAAPAPDPEADAYIIFTSGTTGMGRPVAGKLAGLDNFIRWQIAEFGFDGACRIGQICQPTFDAYFRDVFLPLCTGGELCIPDPDTKQDISRLVQWLRDNQITVIHTVPTLFRLITAELQHQAPGKPLPALRKVFLAGEPLFPADIKRFHEAAGPETEIINLYGTTETTMAKTFYRVGEADYAQYNTIPAGRPIEGAAIAVVNRGRMCRAGEIGEILIKTPYRTNGYYRNQALTDTVFVPNPLNNDPTDIVYKTGDLGRYHADKNIEVIGRLDDQVKVNGVRIDLVEMEAILSRLEGVERAILKTRPDPYNNNEILCYYKGEIGLDEFKAAVRTRLSDFVLPAYFSKIDQVPMTLNGKVDKKALPDIKLPTQPVSTRPYRNETERKVKEVWSSVLGIDALSLNTSFFASGGNSIKAIQLVSRLQKVFSVSISIADIFARQTIEQQTDFIGTLKNDSVEIPRIEEQQYYSTSNGQHRILLTAQIDTSNLFNMYDVYRLMGQVDLDALEECFGTLVARHESLRTNFITVGHTFRQVVREPESVTFRLTVVRGEFTEEEIGDCTRSYIMQPFDLKEDLLLRVLCLQRPGNPETILCINLHHIISDAWSVGVLLKELTALYAARISGRTETLPALPLQYKDFTAWQNKQLQQLMGTDRKFWAHYVAGFAEGAKVVTDFPEQRRKISGRTGICEICIPPAESRKLLQLAEALQVTPFVVTLTYLQLLVGKLSNRTAPILCTTVTDRSNLQLENQIGFYVNMLPVQASIEGNAPFAANLRSMAEHWFTLMKHRLYPYDLIVQEIKTTLGKTYTELFNVGFTWHDDTVAPAAKPDLGFTVSEFFIKYYEARWDLFFHANLSENKSFVIRTFYDTSLFKPASVEWMMSVLEQGILETIRNPSVTVNQAFVTHAPSVAIEPSLHLNFSI